MGSPVIDTSRPLQQTTSATVCTGIVEAAICWRLCDQHSNMHMHRRSLQVGYCILDTILEGVFFGGSDRRYNHPLSHPQLLQQQRFSEPSKTAQRCRVWHWWYSGGGKLAVPCRWNSSILSCLWLRYLEGGHTMDCSVHCSATFLPACCIGAAAAEHQAKDAITQHSTAQHSIA